MLTSTTTDRNGAASQHHHECCTTRSDLDVVLRARGIDSLVLTGIAPNAVVRYPLCQANDLDFGLAVLSDACPDTGPETHRVLIERLFPQWEDVVTVDKRGMTIAPQ
ncbi:isochorismatase family protein [Streptomyces sp. YGL11-2]|uniref:isochorismatase family protein n=1 Tax=Streptomyces sp. YGL11-2 TaxID=3414028 RepID=UPI003CF5A5C5